MKSIFLTLLMFIVVFSLASFHAFDIIGSNIFAYSAKVGFILVLLAGLLLVGVPQNKYTNFIVRLSDLVKQKLHIRKNAAAQTIKTQQKTRKHRSKINEENKNV